MPTMRKFGTQAALPLALAIALLTLPHSSARSQTAASEPETDGNPAVPAALLQAQCTPVAGAATGSGTLPIQGLSSPGIVSTSMVTLAVPTPDATMVSFFIDGNVAWTVAQPP